MAKFFHVELADDERERLAQLVRGGGPSARKFTRARVDMLADAGEMDEEIRAVRQISLATVCRLR